jgi:hypothetical protein
MALRPQNTALPSASTMNGANGCLHTLTCTTDLHTADLAEVDRLLAELDNNLSNAKLSLKREYVLIHVQLLR